MFVNVDCEHHKNRNLATPARAGLTVFKSYYYYTLHPSLVRKPPIGKIENGVAYAPKAKASFALAHT